MSHRPTWRHPALVRGGVGLLVLFALAGFQRVVGQWGNRTWILTAGLTGTLAILAIAVWVLAVVRPPTLRVFRSLARTFAHAFPEDPQILRLRERYPRASAWLGRRLSTDSWRGLYLTCTAALATYWLGGFLSIAKGVASAAVITSYDVHLSALLRAFRTPDVTRLLWVFTVAGDARVASFLAVLTTALLLLWGHRRAALFMAMAVGGGTLLGAATKLVFSRPRPAAAFSLVKTPGSFSFPSGHALYSLLFWGALAFLAVRLSRRPSVRLAAVGVAFAVAGLTGFSRIYLGVHWMSDVVASWMLGLFWLALCAGGYLALHRYGPDWEFAPVGERSARSAATAIAPVAAAAVIAWGALSDPLLASVTAPLPPLAWAVTVDASGRPAPTQSDAAALPRFSEKPDGTPQEPIGLIFVGTRSTLIGAYEAAGWSLADKPSATTLLRASAAAVSDSPYPTAPVTPTFLGGNVQDIAFEKPDGVATVRRRHHCRWWRTRFTLGGQPVWVATASFDASLEIGSSIPLPTHHIAPDIDAEQRFEVADLVRSGLVETTRVRVSAPLAGTDAQGDQWFSQGMATVLVAR